MKSTGSIEEHWLRRACVTLGLAMLAVLGCRGAPPVTDATTPRLDERVPQRKKLPPPTAVVSDAEYQLRPTLRCAECEWSSERAELARYGVVDRFRIPRHLNSRDVEHLGDPPLTQGLRVSDEEFLFWDKARLFRARGFTATLEDLGEFPSTITYATRDPRGVLIHAGGRWLKRHGQSRLIPIDPTDLWDVAVGAANSGFGLSFDGKLSTSLDRGVTWKPLDGSGQFVAIHRIDEQVVATDLEGHTFALASDGSKKAHTGWVPRKRSRELTLLDEAYVSGLVTKAGFVWVWDARSRKVVELDVQRERIAWESAAVGGAFTCRLAHLKKEPLLLCSNSTTVTVYGGYLAHEPRLMREVKTHNVVDTDRQLVIDGACEAERPHSACVYEDKAWRSYAVGSLVPPNSKGRVHFIPRAHGAPYGYLMPENILLDPVTRSGRKLAPNVHQHVAHAVGMQDKYSLADGWFFVDEHDVLRGYSAHGGLSYYRTELVPLDGVSNAKPPDGVICQSGPHMLSVDKKSKSMLQSSDYGVTWTKQRMLGTEDEPPLGCSDLGASWKSYVRVGWPDIAPSREPTVAPTPTAENSQVRFPLTTQRPLLECQAQGKWSANVRALLKPEQDTRSPAEFVTSFNYWLSHDGREVARIIESGAGSSLEFSVPAKPKWKTLTAKVPTFRLNSSAALRASNEYATEVLYAPSAKITGWLLTDGEHTDSWLVASTQPELRLKWLTAKGIEGAKPFDQAVMSANGTMQFLAIDDPRVVLLASNRQGELVIGKRWPLAFAGTQRPRTIVGIDATGAVVPITLSTSKAPPLDSEFALRMDGVPEPRLASWSSIRFANDPHCVASPDDLRITLDIRGATEPGALDPADAWLGLVLDGKTTIPDSLTLRARWNRERICIESAALSFTLFAQEKGINSSEIASGSLTIDADTTRWGARLETQYPLGTVAPAICRWSKP